MKVFEIVEYNCEVINTLTVRVPTSLEVVREGSTEMIVGVTLTYGYVVGDKTAV